MFKFLGYRTKTLIPRSLLITDSCSHVNIGTLLRQDTLVRHCWRTLFRNTRLCNTSSWRFVSTTLWLNTTTKQGPISGQCHWPRGFDKANRIQSNESPVGACKALSVCPVVERSHGQSIIQLEKDIYAWHILTLRLVVDTLPSKMSSWAWCFMTCRPHICMYIYILIDIQYHTIPYHCITLHCIAFIHIYIYTCLYIYIQIIYIIRLGTSFVAP